jgi:hypothetical protein
MSGDDDWGGHMRVRRILWAGALTTGTLLALNASPAVSQATSAVRVDGVYRIVSTDCYFAGGKCQTTFRIEQAGTTLFDLMDRHFHGHVVGTKVVVGEKFGPGTVEDGWKAVGQTTDGGKTVSGNFMDGVGGSGTFTMTFLRPL